MSIDSLNLKTLAVFPNMMTVPDCIVNSQNKIGRGHGEAKFYIASKEEMYSFYGRQGFVDNCFMLKRDLLAYMEAIKNEYMHPSQNYTGKDKLPFLWHERVKAIEAFPDVIEFKIYDQYQIAGPRGYVNSDGDGYQLIRILALPLVSYIYAEKVGTEANPLFYWKLFVDFNAIWERKNGPLVFNYGQNRNNLSQPQEGETAPNRNNRIGQDRYRERVLEQCHFCPFTMVSDERLLIASHIKPWAACESDDERLDGYNGYALTPLYDKLFDRGFITFSKEKHLILSEYLSPYVWKQLNLKNDTFIQQLPMDEKRAKYLEFHHEAVFKGNYAECAKKFGE